MVCGRSQEEEDKKNKMNKKLLVLHLEDVFWGNQEIARSRVIELQD